MLLNTVFFQAAAWQWEHTLSVGCPHSFQTSRAAPKLQKAFSCDYREGPICKVPPSTHRAATAAPSSQVASQQRVRLELPWQEAAKCLWLPIKWMLFIKNVFSVTCFSHPNLSIPGISQGQLCTGMSPSYIATPWSEDFSSCLWAQRRAALRKHQVGHTPQ